MGSGVIDQAELARAVAGFLRALGHPAESSDELASTPARVAQAWAEDLLDGYSMNPEEILAPLASEASDLVVVTDLPLHGVCAHHLLPFWGAAHVAYRPRGLLAGLSCLGRLVDCFAHRLTLQERIAREVVLALETHLGAAGAGCVLVAHHTCMIARGTRQVGAQVLAASFSGTLAMDGADRALMQSAIGPLATESQKERHEACR